VHVQLETMRIKAFSYVSDSKPVPGPTYTINETDGRLWVTARTESWYSSTDSDLPRWWHFASTLRHFAQTPTEPVFRPHKSERFAQTQLLHKYVDDPDAAAAGGLSTTLACFARCVHVLDAAACAAVHCELRACQAAFERHVAGMSSHGGPSPWHRTTEDDDAKCSTDVTTAPPALGAEEPGVPYEVLVFWRTRAALGNRRVACCGGTSEHANT
jgi:hypothetical protein